MIFWISLLVALNFFIHLIVESLNLSYLGRPMPKEFGSIWDQEKYRRSQEYLKANTVFGLFSSFCSTVVTILFLYKGLPWFDSFIRSFGFGEAASGVLFFALLILAAALLSLPFSAYSTFVIEEKFGFNRTSVATFFKDFFVETALSLVIMSLLLGSIFLLFSLWGSTAWILCFAVFCLYTLFLYYITQIWILPLFNRFTPLTDGPLREAVNSYISSQNFDLSEVYTIDGSKRSNKVNAYFTGLGKTKRVALFDTLIENYTIKEIVAILAHEVGHCKKHHVEKGLAISIAVYGVLFYLFGLFVAHISTIYIAAFLFIAAFGAISWIPTALLMALSRKNEFEADAFAKKTAEGKELISALLKLSADNLSNLTPHPLKVLLSYSHPTVVERIRALEGR